MTYLEVASLMDSTQLSYAYLSFPEGEAPELPYICYYYPDRDDVPADNINYVVKENLVVELYTASKDFNTEAQVEAVLTAAGFYFSKAETYLYTEHMYMVQYRMQVLID